MGQTTKVIKVLLKVIKAIITISTKFPNQILCSDLSRESPSHCPWLLLDHLLSHLSPLAREQCGRRQTGQSGSSQAFNLLALSLKENQPVKSQVTQLRSIVEQTQRKLPIPHPQLPTGPQPSALSIQIQMDQTSVSQNHQNIQQTNLGSFF